MNKHTIIARSRPISYQLAEGLHWIALISLILLPCWGIILDGHEGWITNPPIWYAEPPRRPTRWHPQRSCGRQHFHRQAAWAYARRSFEQVMWQQWLLVTLCGLLSAVGEGDGLPMRWWAVSLTV